MSSDELKNQLALQSEFCPPSVERTSNPIPFADRAPYRLVSDRKIIEVWFKIAPEVEDVKHLEDRVALALKIDKKRVIRAMKKACLKEHAKEMREEILREVYTDKLPVMKSIVSSGLRSLESFVQRYLPRTIEGAVNLKNIIKDLHGMLRLETGQSTQNIEQHVRVTKTAEQIITELKEVDPFKDYEVKS